MPRRTPALLLSLPLLAVLTGCVSVERDSRHQVLALAGNPQAVFGTIVVGETTAADLARHLGTPSAQRPLDNGNALHSWHQPGGSRTRVQVLPLLDLRLDRDTGTRWQAEVRDGTVVRYWSE